MPPLEFPYRVALMPPSNWLESACVPNAFSVKTQSLFASSELKSNDNNGAAVGLEDGVEDGTGDGTKDGIEVGTGEGILDGDAVGS